MNMMDLLQVGASMIQNNSDDSTTGLDSDMLTSALGGLLGGGGSDEAGGLDLGSIIGSLTGGGEDSDSNDISAKISSWIGNGENETLEIDEVSTMISDEKIAKFAEELGISEESARQALADAIPEVINQATPEDTDGGILAGLLEQVGGVSGAMNLAGKLLNNR